MNKLGPVGVHAPEEESAEDLELRLKRLRSRMEAEGRHSAVSALDKAISRAISRRSRKAAGE